MSEFYEVFNHRRYQKDGTQLQSAGDDALANAGMIIQFVHIPTGNIINFKAFIESFTETYKSSWSTETVLGRMDPIYLFGSTDRAISLAFKAPASTAGEAYENLGKAQSLIQFLYPTYKNTGRAQTIVQSPLLRVKIMNMLRDVNNLQTGADSDSPAATSLYNSYDMGGNGLLGFVTNISFNHNMDTNNGVVEKYNPGDGTLQAILPKLIEINMDIQPIHEHPLGWNANDEFGKFRNEDGSQFPYGAPLHVAPPDPWRPEPTPPSTAPPEDNPEDEELIGDGPEDPDVPVEDPPIDEIVPGGDSSAAEEDAARSSVQEDLDAPPTGRCWLFCSRRGRSYSSDDDGEYDPEITSEDEIDYIGQYTGREYGEGASSARTRQSAEEYYGPLYDPGSLFSEEEIDIMQQESYYEDWGSGSDFELEDE